MDEECVYCYNEVTPTEAPDATDEGMWAIIAEEHDPDCEWIAEHYSDSPDILARVHSINIVCRCCGKNLGLERFMDDAPIHTRCIPKHWGKHAHGINASRCADFGRR